MVTALILTRNAGPCFTELLEALQKQTVKPAQIIVVDSDSTDQTPELAGKQNCKIIKINRADFDHGTARNLAMSQVSTEFAVFLTQDAIPADEHMIAELVNPMQADSNIAVSYGRQLPRPNARPLERFARQFNYPAQSMLKTKDDIENLGLKTFFCSNSCSAVRLCVFNELGGFKNNVITNEDMLFAAKAVCRGYSVYYSASAKVCHSHSHSLLAISRRYFRIGRFFAGNSWLLQHARLGAYGTEMLKNGLREFWRKGRFGCILALLLQTAVKVIACKSGGCYQLLRGKCLRKR